MANSITATKSEIPNLFKNPYDFYLWSLSVSDKRTKGWFLIDSPIPMLGCIAVYLFLVWIGPKLMKNRKPFNLKGLMIFYNFFMAFLNGYILLQILISSRRLQYSYICQPVRDNFNADEIKIAKTIWWFFISKLVEFCDTFFFILRKKEKQLTFLHVYHHSTMFLLWWIGTKWVPSGSSFFPAMENAFVHVLMYLYYALAAFGPKFERHLWWKKYLTIVQLIQFIIAALYSMTTIISRCDYPLWISYSNIIYMIVFLFLFGKFYNNSYTNEKNKCK